MKQKATHPNHVWSYDFVEDRTEKGGKIRILNVMDEFARESLAMQVARSIKATDVIHTLEWLFLIRGAPTHIRSDNGPGFVAKAVQGWLENETARRFTSRQAVHGRIRILRVSSAPCAASV